MINLEFRVRWYQRKFHEALVNRTHDRLIAIWHRRAGKDEIALQGVAELTEREIGTYWHCFPEHKQARKAIWNGVNQHTGQRRIHDAFPEPTIKRMQDDDMFIELHNGSTYQLLGSDRYDATVGSGPRGIIYSEWALSNPAAWAYHSPMIREAKGWASFITTPRGDNHAKTMYEAAVKDPDWFAELLSIEDTGSLSSEELAKALIEYQTLHGEDLGLAIFEQEYLCSFAGAMVGAYFGAEMARAERDGRIRPVKIDREHPVHSVMDLGKAVNNPIIFFQVIADRPRIVDFYRPESDDLTDWCAWMAERGYNGNDYVPHDIMVTEWGTNRTRYELLQEKRGKPPVRVARVSVADGLQAARTTINSALMHLDDDDRGERMKLAINGAKAYRREWDEDLQRFRDNPVKDWAEHIGSAFRYLGLAWREVVPPLPKKEKPKEVEYKVTSTGIVEANVSVMEAVEAMKRRRNRE